MYLGTTGLYMYLGTTGLYLGTTGLYLGTTGLYLGTTGLTDAKIVTKFLNHLRNRSGDVDLVSGEREVR